MSDGRRTTSAERFAPDEVAEAEALDRLLDGARPTAADGPELRDLWRLAGRLEAELAAAQPSALHRPTVALAAAGVAAALLLSLAAAPRRPVPTAFTAALPVSGPRLAPNAPSPGVLALPNAARFAGAKHRPGAAAGTATAKSAVLTASPDAGQAAAGVAPTPTALAVRADGPWAWVVALAAVRLPPGTLTVETARGTLRLTFPSGLRAARGEALVRLWSVTQPARPQYWPAHAAQ
jgi:hypothetical protein